MSRAIRFSATEEPSPFIRLRILARCTRHIIVIKFSIEYPPVDGKSLGTGVAYGLLDLNQLVIT